MRRFASPALLSAITIILAACATPAVGETIYAVVFGNQKLLVGSSTLSSGLFRSTDDGETWSHLGIPNLKSFSMDADDAERGRRLYIAAGNGVHRSTDAGESWRVVTDWRVTEVLDVRVDLRNRNTIWAATAWGLWRSDNGGDLWRFVPLQEKRRPGRRGVIYSYRFVSDGKRLLLLCDSAIIELPLRGRPRVIQYLPSPRAYRHTTFGAAIGAHPFFLAHLLLPRSPNRHVYDLLVDSSTTPHSLLAAGESGIHTVRLASDPRWNDLTGALPTRVVHGLALTARGTLLAATWGEGIWRRDRENGRWSPSGLEGCQVWRIVAKPW